MTTRLGGRIALLLGAWCALLPAVAHAQSWREVTLSRQPSGEDALSVVVRYGAGRLSVGSLEGPLYRMQLRYDEDHFAPLADYETGSRRASSNIRGTLGELRIGVEGTGKRSIPGKDRFEGEMDLELGRDLPMALEMDFGAVQANIDLGGLSLTDLSLRTGASETRLDVSSRNRVLLRQADLEVGAADFTALRLGNLNTPEIEVSAGVGKVRLELTGEWQRDAHLKVDMGLGSLELVVPEGLAIKVTRETFLTSFDSEGLVKRGDAHYSPDWESAERKVDIEVNAAFGSIKVLWVR
jgi:hypothetical protein